MKDSEVYLRAAEKIADHNEYSCCAIKDIVETDPDKSWVDAVRKYADIFRPAKASTILWMNRDEDGNFDLRATEEEIHKWRVLALLFMHQIAKDEERR